MKIAKFLLEYKKFYFCKILVSSNEIEKISKRTLKILKVTLNIDLVNTITLKKQQSLKLVLFL